MGFSQGLSGLSAAAKALDVVGNNIANSQTVGFKAGSVSFADIFAGSNGMGVQIASVDQKFSNGVLAGGSSPLDMGINGNGFFRMVDSAGSVFYGRNGQFKEDENGYIVNRTNGLFLSGYQATDGVINPGAPVGPIRIPKEDVPPEATTKGSMSGNLNSGHDPLDPTKFDPEKGDTYSYFSEMRATDSLGNEHTIKVYFVKTGDNQWTAFAQDGTAPEMDGTDPKFTEIPLAYTDDGKLTSSGIGTVKGVSWNGGAPIEMELDLSKMTQYASDDVAKSEANGQKLGKFNSYEVSESGEITAIYNNGQRKIVAQVVLADFANPGGLEQQGNNLWAESVQSGTPFIGISGSGSFGDIAGGMVEQSNVELGDEMVNMIVYQRNYQSNSQTIKTQSEVLQTLVNLR
ncbi:flagellar hook protein FlgE [Enterobacter sp. KBR-315C3_2022]|uniref:flagellar hook protein FlgE n=1 Tax=Enterobacter sp. KBR-315C3_2022 TaxID=3242494 RepID=UPI003529AECA